MFQKKNYAKLINQVVMTNKILCKLNKNYHSFLIEKNKIVIVQILNFSRF